MKNIKASVLKHSQNPDGTDLVTFLVTFPRFILPEILTHRVLSRNTSSSRAIPTKKLLAAIEESPAEFEYWGKNQSGMSAKETLTNTDIYAAKKIISNLRGQALESSRELTECVKLHKQSANRYLEPWMHTTMVISATEWSNFFGLRAHKDAQPEFQVLAYRMANALIHSTPEKLEWGEYHIPFTLKVENSETPYIIPNRNPVLRTTGEFVTSERALIHGTACCARTSYTTHEGSFTKDKQKSLYDSLSSSGHWSPFEHCAKAEKSTIKYGNFAAGWKQHRYDFRRQSIPEIDLRSVIDNKPDWITLD